MHAVLVGDSIFDNKSYTSGERLQPFERGYERAIAALASPGRDLTICTIYNGRFDGDQSTLIAMALCMFNDVILRVALARRARNDRAGRTSTYCRGLSGNVTS